MPIIRANRSTPIIYPGQMARYLRTKTWYTIVHKNFTYNSPKLEPIQMSTHRWISKQIMIHPCNGMLLSNTKNWITDIYNHTVQSQNDYAEQTKSDKREYSAIQFTWNPSNTNSSVVTETSLGVAWGLRVSSGRERYEVTLGGDGCIHCLYCGWVSWVDMSDLIRLYTLCHTCHICVCVHIYL